MPARWARRGALTLAFLAVLGDLALVPAAMLATFRFGFDTPSATQPRDVVVIALIPVIAAAVSCWYLLRRRASAAKVLVAAAGFSWFFAVGLVPTKDPWAYAITLAPGALLALAAGLHVVSEESLRDQRTG